MSFIVSGERERERKGSVKERERERERKGSVKEREF